MKLIRNGRMVGTPLDGIEHYDLRRLSAQQAFQFDEILRKARTNVMLTAQDLKDLVVIRKAVKCAAPVANARKELPSDLQKLGAMVAEFKTVAEDLTRGRR